MNDYLRVKKAEQIIMKKFMLWYIPRSEKIYKASEIVEKLESIAFDFCVDSEDFPMHECEPIIGRLLPAVIAFYEKF